MKTMRCHYTSLVWLKLTGLITLSIARGNIQQELSDTAGKDVKWYDHFQKQF